MEETSSFYNQNSDPIYRAVNKPYMDQKYLEIWKTLVDFWWPLKGLLDGVDAIERIEEYRNLIEGLMKEILQRHSPAYWIILGRYDRISRFCVQMKLHYEGREKTEYKDVYEATIKIYEDACKKYGNGELLDLELDYSVPTALRTREEITEDDIIEARLIFELSIAYDAANECYRLANKGAKISVDERPPFLYVQMTPDMERLWNVYQSRCKHMVPGSSFGTLTAWNGTESSPYEGLNLFEYTMNLDPLKVFARSNKPWNPPIGTTPYRRGQIDISQFWSVVQKFPGVFQSTYQVEAHAFLATWVGLHRCVEAGMLQIRQYQCGPQINGFMLLPPFPKLIEQLQPYVQEVAVQLGLPLKNKAILDAIRRCLLIFAKGPSQSIDLAGESEMLSLLLFEDFCLLDLTNSRGMFQVLLDSLRKFHGRSAAQKGDMFESELEGVIRDEYPACVFWEEAKSMGTLKFGDGSHGEFDLAIVRGNCLILVEAKAYSVAKKYFRGDREVLMERERDLRKAVQQVTTHAEKLAKYPRTDSYSIPEGIEYVVPVVCTAMPEWFSTLHENDLLAPKIPRICTPRELGRIVRHNGPKYFEKLPYTIKVSVSQNSTVELSLD